MACSIISSSPPFVNAGPYTFGENNVAGYTEGTWSCTGATATGTAYNAGGVTVPNGGTVVCTITNDDQPGSLQLVKVVTNDNGGTKTAADFPEDACLSFHATERVVNTASASQVRSPVYKEAVGYWQNYAEQLDELREVLKPVL